MECDLLIVGAGPVGCVVAERAAREGWSSVVVERRRHIAGNCHDYVHASGILLHAYGPHYFRTNDSELLAYLAAYTEWMPAQYIVRVLHEGTLYPFPINLTTLEQFFGQSFTEESAKAFLATQSVPCTVCANSEEFVLSRVGRALYQAFYFHYTCKQWGRHPRELAPEVCGRIPVRFSRDERYVDHQFQVMPRDGYTALFERMLHHPLITLRTGATYEEVRSSITPRIATVYTGPLDHYFNDRLGALPWRSLRFALQEYPVEFHQPCVQVNYADDRPATRSVEIKHVTGQEHPHTVVVQEYPESSGDPFYPIPSVESRALATAYAALAERERLLHGVYFAGRLATYAYLNMDQAIAQALQLFTELRQDWRHGKIGRRDSGVQ